MADTQRSVSAITALLADNTDGQISAQDLRDAFTTWRMGHGEISVPAASPALVTISDTTNYFEVSNPVWTLGSGAHWFDESGGNGRLTFTGTAQVVAHVACSLSFTCASSNQVVHVRIGKNTGTLAESEVQRKVGTGTDVGSTALHVITTMSSNDYLSLWVRNATSAADITVTVANLQAMSMPA